MTTWHMHLANRSAPLGVVLIGAVILPAAAAAATPGLGSRSIGIASLTTQSDSRADPGADTEKAGLPRVRT
jgi:hypothetical protein